MGAAPRDEGMTLIEVIVALALFLVVTGAVLKMLGGAITLAAEDRYRMVATSLAARELEITRDAFSSRGRGPTTITTDQVVNPDPLPDGTPGAPLVVDDVPYTVTRTAQWAQTGSAAASTCDDGGTEELAVLRVKVEVTWPGLGDRPPVEMDTVMAPSKGIYSTSTGHLSVRALDATAAPVGGLTIRIAGPGGTRTSVSAADGCAVFGFLTPGSYTVDTTATGLVTPDGTTSKTVSVQSGLLTRTTVQYDTAARVRIEYQTVAGHTLGASGFPVTLTHSRFSTGQRTLTGTVSAGVQQLTAVWPDPAGYGLWAGACADSDPSKSARPVPLVPAEAGETATVQVPLASVALTGGGSGKTVTATRAADATCPAGATITLGTTSSAGALKTALPYGAWTLRTSSPVKTKAVTLAWGAGATTAVGVAF